MRLPSLQPALTTFDTPASDMTSRTPSTFAMCQAKRSIASMIGKLMQPSAFVSTITLMMSVPIENRLLIRLLSRL